MKEANSYDLIIALIKGCQCRTLREDTEFNLVTADVDGLSLDIGSPSYLLKQVLYTIWLPHNHYCVSKKAYELWNKITLGTNDIFSFGYKSKIKVECEKINLKCYKGSSSEAKEKIFYKGNLFEFREVFHDEHIVPLGMIFDELIKINFTDDDASNYKKVQSILDKIYVCKMLKEEDRQLNKVAKTRRSSINYDEILDNEYTKAGIEVYCFRN